uniref:PIG-P domain-containing protein n=1 Tax=Arundo donax TaxID=35708 RepID=A0A0A9HLW9_ARUDO
MPPGAASDRSSEAYGFAGSIAAVAATLAYLVRAYAPEPWLLPVGVAYYPSKYWALAVPSFVLVAAYMGSNLLLTPPPGSLHTVHDEYARERSMPSARGTGAEKPVEPIADIGIHQINHLIFDNR